MRPPAAPPLSYALGASLDPAALCALYAQTRWAAARAPQTVAAMLEGTTLHVSAWRGPRLVGFARALSDGVFRAFVEDVVVAEAERGRGVGRELVARLLERLGPVEETRLHCRAPLDAFYAEFGFAPCGLIHMEKLRRG